MAHKFWPKGVLHGAKEEWETKIKPAIVGDKDDDDDRRGRHGRDRYRDAAEDVRDDRRRKGVGSKGGRVYYEEDVVMSGGAGNGPPLRRTRSARLSNSVERAAARGRASQSSAGAAQRRAYEEAHGGAGVCRGEVLQARRDLCPSQRGHLHCREDAVEARRAHAFSMKRL